MALADGNISIALSDLDPDWLKANYLTGLEFVDAKGKPYPPSFFETHMQNAVRTIEMLCDITILELTITSEEHDYHAQDYLQWGWLQLFKVPVKSVTKLRGVFPLGVSIVTYPGEWIQIRGDAGQINVVPNQGALGSVIIGQGGDFLPVLYGGISSIPNLWQVDYVAGMDPDNLPREIVEVIAKMACIDILTIMSDLVRAIGVSSESASIDGLSQSMSYQLPAFQARIARYTEELYGPNGKSQEMTMTSGKLKQLYDKYRPINMVST